MHGRLLVITVLSVLICAPALSGSIRGDSTYLYVVTDAGIVTEFRFNGPTDTAGQVFADTYVTNSALPDGQYSYEVSGYASAGAARTAVDTPSSNGNTLELDDGRSDELRNARRGAPEVVLESGYFRIQKGVVLVDKGEVEQ